MRRLLSRESQARVLVFSIHEEPIFPERAFQAGVASFGLGHALYGVAFALRGVDTASAAIAGALLSLLAWRVYRWLAPGVPAQLKPAVAAYCTIITAMVAIACGTTVATSDPRIFACGDMRRGQSLVVWAIREGRQCARAVDMYLMGKSELPR